MSPRAKAKAEKAPERGETFEMFGTPFISYRPQAPSSFNGAVEVERFRVTVARIDEPAEVYQARLQKLWEECDNHHQWAPIQAAAKRFGVALVGQQGAKRKRA